MGLAARIGWPGWPKVGLAGLAGLIIALGQVPFTLPLLAFLALFMLMAALSKASSAKSAFWLGLFAGAGHFLLALSWIVQPFFVDPWRHGWMAPFALLGLAFGLGLFWAVAAAVAQRARWPLAALACTLALADLLRGHIFTGFPWALHGHILLDTRLEQVAAAMGGYGISALVLVAAGIAAHSPRRGLPFVLIAAVGVMGLSTLRLMQPLPPAPGGTLRIVQPNIPQTLKWDADEARASFATLLDLTATPATQMPNLAIWPETAVPFLLTEGEGAAAAIGASPVPVAAGIQRVDGPAAWNSLVLIGPGGSITQTYDKIHLVPFGEYIPYGDTAYALFGLRAFAAQQGFGYSAGTVPHLMDLGPGLGLARPLICYEAIFPEEIATQTRPAWLLQVTNDAWFGTLTGPYQHFALARLRAIEQGLPLVRAANTGISAVVDARGQIVTDTSGAPAILPLGVQGIIDAVLPGALPPTPYARTGDWPLTLLLLMGLFAALRLPRRVKKA